MINVNTPTHVLLGHNGQRLLLTDLHVWYIHASASDCRPGRIEDVLGISWTLYSRLISRYTGRAFPLMPPGRRPSDAWVSFLVRPILYESDYANPIA